MKDNYFVLFERRLGYEKSEKARGKMVYGAKKLFEDYNEGLTFADRNLPAILAKRTPLTEQEHAKIKDKNNSYVVAGFHKYKYHDYFQGEQESMPVHEVGRCMEADLEKVVENFRGDGATEILVGVELKVLGGTLV